MSALGAQFAEAGGKDYGAPDPTGHTLFRQAGPAQMRPPEFG